METMRDLASSHPYITGFTAVAATYALYHVLIKKKKPSLVKAPPNTVVLYQLDRGPYAPSMSPFVIKLETYLRINGIPYQNDFGSTMSYKGKIPWISFNGEALSDSQFIIEFLNKKFDKDLNQGFSKQERIVAHSLRVLVDEHLQWCVAYFRWQVGVDQSVMKVSFKSWFLRHFISRLLKKELYGQGMGRHNVSEVKSVMLQDLQTLADQLGDKPFLMGDRPTEVDCSAFGMLVQMVYHATDDIVGGLVKDQFPSLFQYCERMKARVWPDWEDCNTNGGTKKATK